MASFAHIIEKLGFFKTSSQAIPATAGMEKRFAAFLNALITDCASAAPVPESMQDKLFKQVMNTYKQFLKEPKIDDYGNPNPRSDMLKWICGQAYFHATKLANTERTANGFNVIGNLAQAESAGEPNNNLEDFIKKLEAYFHQDSRRVLLEKNLPQNNPTETSAPKPK